MPCRQCGAHPAVTHVLEHVQIIPLCGRCFEQWQAARAAAREAAIARQVEVETLEYWYRLPCLWGR